MSHRSTLSRLAIVSLAAAALATAPATAMPTDPPGTSTTQEKRQQDMHASTVQPADKAAALNDLRGEAAAGGGTGGGETGGLVVHGPPTWPAHPTPLPPPAQQPVAVDGDNGGIDVEVPVALLILAGTLAVGGGVAVAAMKGRENTRVAH